MRIKYSDITFVIPYKNSSEIETIKSIPKECKFVLRNDKTRGEARNIGARLVKTPYIIFADSDIKFNKNIIKICIEMLKLSGEKTIIGLEAYYPSHLIISRFMVMKTETFNFVGNMCNRQHGEETEWVIRAEEKGCKLIKIPRESVYHYPHPNSEYKNEFYNILWLIYKHPKYPFKLIYKIYMKMLKSNYEV